MFGRRRGTSSHRALRIAAAGVVCLLLLLTVHHLLPHADEHSHHHGLADSGFCPLCVLLTTLVVFLVVFYLVGVSLDSSYLPAGRRDPAPAPYLRTTCTRRGPPFLVAI